MGKKHNCLIYKNLPISYLKVKEGDSEVMKWDKETKQKVKTGQKRHWRIQEFSFPLDEGCGYATGVYYGDITLVEGGFIEIGAFYPKQKKWSYKDPKTFVEKKQSKIVFVLHSMSKLIAPVETPATETFTPISEEKPLVDVNEEFKIEEEQEKEEYSIPELE